METRTLSVRSRPLREISRLLTDFFHAKGSPLNLAVFRIVVCFALLFHAPRASDYLALPDAWLHVPLGSDLVFLLTPRSETGHDVLWWVFTLACLCGFVGLYARTAMAVAAATGLLVYGLPQFYGKVDHSHHLVWFAVLLACSPCGDALSVDRWRASPSGRIDGTDIPPAQRYALPLRIVWLLMGLIYFFPGAWKMLAVGWTWALSDNLKYTLYHKWFDLGGHVPPFRVDAYPFVYRTLGLGAVAFEVGFIFAIFLAPLRRLLVIAGLAFHTWIRLFLDIKLHGLAWCYVAFIDWAGLTRRVSASHVGSAPDSASGPEASGTLPVRIAGAVLITGAFLSGAAHLNSWPFACYPTFAAEYGPSIAALRVDAISEGARTTIGPAAIYPIFVTPMRWRVVQYRVLLTTDHEKRRRHCEALRALFTARLSELQTADRVELRQVVRWADPDRQGEPPIADQVLCSWSGKDETPMHVSDDMVDVSEAIPALHRIYLRDAPLMERMRSALTLILGGKAA
jgi:hypothetical protein